MVDCNMAINASIAFEDNRVIVHQTVVGKMSNNVYVVRSKSTGQALLIDAAADGEDLLAWSQDLDVDQVLTTHGHWDHTDGVPSFSAAEVPVGIGFGPDDSETLKTQDFEISDGQRFSLGDVAIEAIATPGHTSGSICLAVIDSPLLFTGDTLFPGGPGATRSATSDFRTIIESIRSRLFGAFEDDTYVFPGHGLPTTIGAERPSLQEWINRGW